MADPASLSLDDYWKAQKKSGKGSGSFGRGGRGGGGGGGGGRRGRGPKPNASYGGGIGSAGPGPSGNRGNPNSFRGRKGRQQGSNNVQRRRGNRGIGNNRNFTGGVATSNQSRGSFQRFGGGGGQGQGVQGQNRRQRMRNRNRNPNPNPNRQANRRQRNSGGVVNQGFSNQQRYFSNASAIASSAGRPPRNQSKRLRQKKVVGLGNPRAGLNLRAAAATKRGFLQLAQKRVQRAKLQVSKKRDVGIGGPKKLMAGTVGRVALGKNGFFTVRNTKSKQLERTLVKMKIARAQSAKNRGSPQQQRNVNVNLPGSSGMRNRSVNRSVRATNISAPPPHPIDWNTSIVRTMRNDLADEMTTSQLNPEIQRKIAFIQSRSKGARTPVLQDFKAPVTTSRMKLSDRFRLLGDQ